MYSFFESLSYDEMFTSKPITYFGSWHYRYFLFFINHTQVVSNILIYVTPIKQKYKSPKRKANQEFSLNWFVLYLFDIFYVKEVVYGLKASHKMRMGLWPRHRTRCQDGLKDLERLGMATVRFKVGFFKPEPNLPPALWKPNLPCLLNGFS